MALPVITAEDFTGFIKIVSNDFKQDDLNLYIDTFLPKYLRDIVGDEAFLDIKNQDRQKWDDLLDGVDYLDEEGKRRIHNGLVESLKYFIYFQFVRDDMVQTQSGFVEGVSENSSRPYGTKVLNNAVSRYNEGVYLIKTTPDFLKSNESFSEEVTSSVDNSDNTYTIFVPNTKYLEAQDFVKINNVTFEAISVTENTNFVINGGQTGLDFTGDLVEWEPFEDVEFCEIKPSMP